MAYNWNNYYLISILMENCNNSGIQGSARPLKPFICLDEMDELHKYTFKSWKEHESDDCRAIALCNQDGWFYIAINCLRDGDMGRVDENGVYERRWATDYIYDSAHDLRPANREEVDLYLKYVSDMEVLPLMDGVFVGFSHDSDGFHLFSRNAKRDSGAEASGKEIFMPDNKALAQMIEDSWQQCKEQAAEGGLRLTNPDLEAFAKDMFVAGYCYGHNDCLGIIRGQLEAMSLIGDIFGTGNKNEQQ